MPPEEQDYINYRSVTRAVLALLALLVTGMCSLALTILIDHSSQLSANEKWMQQIQDTQNEYAWRVQKNETGIDNLKSQKAEQTEVMDLKAQLATMQRQVDTDQVALHDLANAFQREFPIKHYR